MAHLDMRRIFAKHGKAVITAVLVLAVTIVYFAIAPKIKKTVADALYWEKQEALVKSLLSKVSSPQEVIDLLKRQAEMKQHLIILPQGTDIAQMVRMYAQRMNVRLVRFDAKSLEGAQRQWGHTIVINSRRVQTTTISIEAEAGYKNLARFFDTLYRVAPAVVSVEKLKITSDKKGGDRLKASMELRFYSLKEESK